MTKIAERLDALATSEMQGVRLVDPQLSAARRAGNASRWALTGLVIVFAVVLLAGAFALLGDDDTSVPPAGEPDTTNPSTAPTTVTPGVSAGLWPPPSGDAVAAQPPRLVLTDPALTLATATESTYDIDPSSQSLQAFVRSDNETAVVGLWVRPGEGGADPAEGCVGSVVDVGGAPACLLPDGNYSWVLPDRKVELRRVGVTSDDWADFVQSIAVDRASDQSWEPPTGWERVAHQTGAATVETAANATFGPDQQVELSLTSGSSLDAYDLVLDWAAQVDTADLRVERVNDRVVYLAFVGDGTRAVWMEGEGVVATLIAEPYSLEATVSLLDTLDVDEDAWKAALAETSE